MKEYKKKLIKRMVFYCIVFLLLAASLYVAEIYSGNTHSQSFVMGFLSGIGAVFIVSIIYYIRMMNTPEKLEKMFIKENDERNQEIYLKTTSTTFRIFIIALGCMSLYYAYNDYQKVHLIGNILWMGIGIYAIVYIYYRKKL